MGTTFAFRKPKMLPLVRRRALVILLAITGGMTHACLAPTLPPLPPPQARVSAPVDGEVEITGSIRDQDAGAMVLGLNNDTGAIAGQLLERGETRFLFKLRAETDHTITVFYRAHDEQSETVNLVVEGAEVPDVDAGP